MAPSLDGQVALVSGAGRGIGRATAEALAAAGAAVGLLGRSEETLRDAAAACGREGARAAVLVADVTDPAQVDAAVAAAEQQLGPPDLLVNNAGRADAAETPPWEADPTDWWAVVETNLRGPFLLCRAVLPGMVERGRGRILNVNSGFGLRAGADYSAYSVSKAALSRLTDALVASLGEAELTVLDVSPGLVRSDMTRAMSRWQGVGEEAWTPVQRFLDVVLALAEGRLDALSGRFVHAGRDELDALVARAGELRERDARTLRLRPYGEDDPLS